MKQKLCTPEQRLYLGEGGRGQPPKIVYKPFLLWVLPKSRLLLLLFVFSRGGGFSFKAWIFGLALSHDSQAELTNITNWRNKLKDLARWFRMYFVGLREVVVQDIFHHSHAATLDTLLGVFIRMSVFGDHIGVSLIMETTRL